MPGRACGAGGRRAPEILHAPVTAPRVACASMATLHPHRLQPIATLPRDVADARLRRWCLLAIAAAVLLAAFAGGMAWVAQQVGASVDRSLQPLPEMVRDRPQA